MSRAIVVTSGKGGVGKSSLCVCLGRELARRGRKVTLIDTDVGLNNLDVIQNVESNVVYTLCDVAAARCRLRQALVPDSICDGLYLLPTQRGYEPSVSADVLKSAVTALLPTFDYVFIDCPAGIDVGFARAVSAAQEAIVVTTPHVSAVKDASTVLGLLASYPLKSVRFVLNRVRGDMVVSAKMASVEDVAVVLDVPPLGVIPESDAINGLSSVGVETDDGGLYKQAVRLMCDNLENGSDKILDLTKQYRGIWGALKRALKTRV